MDSTTTVITFVEGGMMDFPPPPTSTKRNDAQLFVEPTQRNATQRNETQRNREEQKM
jgi:hypothetical protein